MGIIDISNVTQVAMGKASRAKGHKYVTLFIDIDTKQLIFTPVG